jgi:glutathione peroxidase
MLMDRRRCLALMAGSFFPSSVVSSLAFAAQSSAVSSMTAYTFSFDALHGKTIRLSDYAGHPIMVVNTASLCGFTPQYAKLQELYSKLGPKGLVIIGVPSNDFGSQEPGGVEDITATTHSYGVTFPMAAKAAVLGPKAHPFYKWAAQERPNDLPRWNFHKYIIGANGHIADVFSTLTDPMSDRVVAAIEREFRSPS